MMTVKQPTFSAGVVAACCLFLSAPAAYPQDEAPFDAKQGKFIEEVIVTAQRREQDLMDVPLSVTAWDGKTLETQAIDNIMLVADITPGLVASGQTTTGGTVNFFIRGIGSNAGGDPGVAYYVDEIYVGASNAFNSSFIDLDRVEILKGPQGTLWGRNTTGGAINIVTKRPTEEYQAEVFAEYADPYTLRLAGAVAGPLSDTVSYRLTAARVQQDSYTQNTLTEHDDQTEDSISVRGQLRFTPNDQLTIDALVGYLHDDAKNLFLFPVINLPGTGAEFVFNYYDVPPNPDLYHIQINTQPESHFEGLETRLDVNYELNDEYNIRWLTGYNDIKSDRIADFDGNFLPMLDYTSDNTQNWLSSELQLQFSSDKMDWTLGIYYYDQDDNNYLTQSGDTDFFFQSSCASPNYANDPNNPSAALCPLVNAFWRLTVPDIFFGAIPGFQMPSLPYVTNVFFGRDPNPSDMAPDGVNPLAQYGLIPNAIFGTGTEYAGGYGNLFDTGLITNQRTINDTQSLSFYGEGHYNFTEQWSITLGARYTEDDKGISTELYGTLFSPAAPPNTGNDKRSKFTPKIGLEFTPNEDTLVYGSITSGFKGAGFGALNNITGELSVFDEETVIAYEIGYKATLADGRVRIDSAAYYYDYDDLQVTLQYANGPVTDNLDKAKVKGVDFAIDWAPTDSFTVGTAIAYNDSEITKFTGGTIYDPTNTLAGPEDIVGNPLPRAPEWSANAYANYTLPLSEGGNGTLVFGGNMGYTGDYNHTQFGNILMTPHYTLWGANITWISPSGAFSVNAFGRNLSDEEYVLTSFFTDAFGVLQFPGAPRTIGIQLRYNYN